MQKKKTLFIVEVGIFSALAFLLDLLANMLQLKIWPQGGSISIAMVPIFIIAFRWGIKGGLAAGFMLGLLQIVTGQAFIAHPLQGFIDYILAFTLVGAAGLTSSSIIRAIKNDQERTTLLYVTLGTFLGSLLRYLCHTAAGVVFFAEYAPKGTPALLYSIIYNGTYMLPGFIISAIISYLLIRSAKRFFFIN
ncbi:MAG TPA: energy-coupled thiamine transporter ThiT [Bacillus sp. (in: firmicutes)]|nr:energy-coupled thiamine transporter ThiT [Bacillus sp. (in: firmicutes)]